MTKKGSQAVVDLANQIRASITVANIYFPRPPLAMKHVVRS